MRPSEIFAYVVVFWQEYSRLIILIIVVFGGTAALIYSDMASTNKFNNEHPNGIVTIYSKIGNCTMYEVDKGTSYNKYFTDCKGQVEWDELRGKSTIRQSVETK